MLLFHPVKKAKELMELLKAGMGSPKSMALSLTLGVSLALFPVIGMTFLLGLMVAVVFRLNHLVVQTLNLLLAPVQLLLIYPFIKAGNLIFAGSRVFKDIFTYSGDWTFLKLIEMMSGGVIVWFGLSLVTMPVLYFSLLRLLKIRGKAAATINTKNNLL
ncbi:MAG TPA: hypothetical protein DER09_02530 [Prolixibacteraceae bacterium]|nr:hypothetical protein [Prolixibacteraceae bacterium]